MEKVSGSGGELEFVELPEPKELVSPEEVLKRTGVDNAAGQVLSLTPIQKAGMQILMGILLLITLATMFAGIEWIRDVPSLSAAKYADSNAMIIAYKELRTAKVEGTTQFFEAMVTKPLLPVLSGILAWLFGTCVLGGQRRRERK